MLCYYQLIIIKKFKSNYKIIHTRSTGGAALDFFRLGVSLEESCDEDGTGVLLLCLPENLSTGVELLLSESLSRDVSNSLPDPLLFLPRFPLLLE